MIEVNKVELKNALILIDEITPDLIQRGKEKLNAEERGFGEKNHIENIVFDKRNVYLDYNDSGYDLIDTVHISLTIAEICMTDEEWEAHIIKIINEGNELKKEHVRIEKEEKKENRRRQYLKLKEEFE